MKPKEHLVLRLIPVQLSPGKARLAACFQNTTLQRHRTQLPSKRDGSFQVQKEVRRIPKDLKAKSSNFGFILCLPNLLSYQHDLNTSGGDGAQRQQKASQRPAQIQRQYQSLTMRCSQTSLRLW